MAKNFAALAFTKEVKKMQERMGSRVSYARMEKNTYVDGLTDNEIDLLQSGIVFTWRVLVKMIFHIYSTGAGQKDF